MSGLQLCKTCRMFQRCMKIMLKNPLYISFTCRAETPESLHVFDTFMEMSDKKHIQKT